jgi:hypothetical protein
MAARPWLPGGFRAGRGRPERALAGRGGLAKVPALDDRVPEGWPSG